MRIGIGYDVHPLVEGRSLVLGGMAIDYGRGLLGHSDADVLVHAIVDALLGAAALRDIGTHFPDSDPQFEGISSILLLKRVDAMIRSHGFNTANIDATIIAEEPKLAPYIDDMRQTIANALQVAVEQVSVKATTSAGLGVLGKAEGIAACAVALIERR